MNNLYIKIWGCRGSLPVSGKQYIKYGGDTTAIELKTLSASVIIDAGSGIRRLGNHLSGNKEVNILFTHSHYDHIVGFPFFIPLYRKTAIINIYGSSTFPDKIENILSATMRPPYFPVAFADIKSENKYISFDNKAFDIKDLTVKPVPLSHPNGGVGFIFIYNNKKFTFLTDNELRYKHHNGLGYDDYVDLCKNSHILIHDAMWTENEYKKAKKWGHSTFDDAVRLAEDSGSKRLILFHHLPERTDNELDQIQSLYGNQESGLKIEIAYQDMELFL